MIRIFRRQVIQRVPNILTATRHVLMFASRRTDTTKVKTQRDQSRVDQAGCRAKDHLVVHSSTAKRMRMAHEADTLRLAIRLFQYRFEPSVRSRYEEVSFWIHA